MSWISLSSLMCYILQFSNLLNVGYFNSNASIIGVDSLNAAINYSSKKNLKVKLLDLIM